MYTSLDCLIFVIAATPTFRSEFIDFKMNVQWPFFLANVLFLFEYIVSLTVGIAVLGMAIWHTYLIVTAQTTIEYHEFQYYKHVTQNTGEVLDLNVGV